MIPQRLRIAYRPQEHLKKKQFDNLNSSRMKTSVNGIDTGSYAVSASYSLFKG